jgi:hypothetical protein
MTRPLRRRLALALTLTLGALALAGSGCDGAQVSTPDAAVVDLRCDDPSLLDDLEAAVRALPDAAFTAPAADSRMALLAAVGQAAGAIQLGPPADAVQALRETLALAIDTYVADAAARATLHDLADTAERALTAPVLACPAQVNVECVPPGGKALDYGAAAADCVDPAPSLTCDPPTGTIVTAGDSPGSCTATNAAGESTTCDFLVHAVPEGTPVITCPDDVSIQCTAVRTLHMLPDPTVEESCGAAATVVDDVPAAGYPVGTTTVTFSAASEQGMADSCTTLVTVSDQTAPSITCPEAVTVIRASPGAAIEVPAVGGVDACDDELAITYAPADPPPGTTDVEFTATDDSGNATSCTTAITVLEAFAPTGVRVASATLAGGSTTITLAWNRTFSADATGYRVERGPDETGPWTALGDVPVGTQIFTDPALPGDRAFYRVVTLAGELDGGAAPAVRAYAIAATDYDLRNQSVPGVSFLTTLYGVVRHPVAALDAPYPLILMLHGNHGICRSTPTSTNDFCGTSNDHECPFAGFLTTPNAEGMAYLAETLAAQGYVAVTISGNAMNCRDDYILQRTSLLLEHMRRWNTWSSTGAPPFDTAFAGVVDMSRVGLVGHSRGGEAVAHVPDALDTTPIAGVTLRSVFSIAPTDYHAPSPDGVPYAVLLPACGGDVWTLVGMDIYDRVLDAADAVPRAQVLMSRANHNFYNTEWRSDDNGDGFVCDVSDEIGADAQQAMLETTLGSWFATTIGGNVFEDFIEADAPTPLGISAWAGADLDLRWSFAAASRTPIDDFSGPNAPDVNLLGEANSFAGFTTANPCNQNGCASDFEHEKDAIRLDWNGGTPTAHIALGGFDAATATVFSFRLVSRESALNPTTLPQDFRIQVADTDGNVAELLLTDVVTVPYLYPSNVPREILQTARVPLVDLVALQPALNLGSLAEVSLVMTAPSHATGSVIVTDLEFAD